MLPLTHLLFRPPTEIPCAAFPRFAHINALSGVLRQAALPSLVREFLLSTPDPITRQPVHVGFLLKAEDVTWVSRYRSGIQVELVGTLTAHFVVTGPGPGTGANAVALKIESLAFESRGHEEMILREALVHERVERLYDTAELHGSSPPAAVVKGKPTKKMMGTRRKSQIEQEDQEKEAQREMEEAIAAFKREGERPSARHGVTWDTAEAPPSPVGSFGIPEMGMRCLEVSLHVFLSIPTP